MAAPQLKLTVTWRSATPIRQAAARATGDAAVSAEEKKLLDRADELYIVALGGVPGFYMRLVPGAATTTFLKRNGKPPIALSEGGLLPGQTLTLFFGFPRTDPITLDDKDVEFVTKLGQIDIKKKFTLKDLVFHGRLDL